MKNNDRKKVLLVVLDGWGYREEKENNAIAEANTPFFDFLWEKYPHSLLKASGEAVGLPEGQMGNSEIGHITIGIGKKIDNDLVRINNAIKSGEFEHNPVFGLLFNHVKKYNSALHVLGLLSPGGIHSHQEHLFEFLRTAVKNGIGDIVIHAFTDGRDTDPQIASKHLRELEDVLEEIGTGTIATATGRYLAMDRDKNWERIQIAYENIFENKGRQFKKARPSEIMKSLHKNGEEDEFLDPVVFLDENGTSRKIEKNDGIFFFNFRADRGRELSTKILEKKSSHNLFYATMSEYDPSFDCSVAFPPQVFEETIGSEVSKAGLKQVHIAETEKFAHATFYLNGGRQEPYENEEQILITTRKGIKKHDEAPQMRAQENSDKAIEKIKENVEFIFVNFANPDVVGHTGNKKAILFALETVDKALKNVVENGMATGYHIFITADHGNAELNVDGNGRPHTAHTTNDVPAILIDHGGYKLKNGTLADIAPTVLELLGIKKPKQMTGKSLIKK